MLALSGSRSNEVRGQIAVRSVPASRWLSVFITGVFTSGLFVLVAQHGVNVPFFDDWTQLSVLPRTLDVTSVFSFLWHQHNENRMLFPNLVVLVLSITHNLDYKYEMYLAAILWGLSFYMVSRSVPTIPTVWKRLLINLVLALIWFAPLQVQNIYWGFQLAWYICTASVVVGVYVSTKNTIPLVIKNMLMTTAGIVASFSSVQGLLFWPIILAVLLTLRYPKKSLAWQTLMGIISFSVYFLGFNFSSLGGGGLGYAMKHVFSLGYFLFVLNGNIVAVLDPSLPANAIYVGAFIAGVAIAGMLATSMWWAFASGTYVMLRTMIIGLGMFGILAEGMTAYGRVGFGIDQAIQTRYIMFSLCALIAVVLGLTGRILASSATSRLRRGVETLGLILVSLMILVAYPGSFLMADQTSAMRTKSELAISFRHILTPTGFDTLVEQNSFPFVSVVKADLPVLNKVDPRMQLKTHSSIESELELVAPAPVGIRETKFIESLQILYSMRPDLEAAFPLDAFKSWDKLVSWSCNSSWVSPVRNVSTSEIKSRLCD